MATTLESNSSVLNALCSDLVENRLKIADVKSFNEYCAAVSTKLERLINKKLSDVNSAAVLQKCRETLTEKGFVANAKKNFGNYSKLNISNLKFQVKTKSLCCIESLFDKSMSCALYVCIPNVFFYNSDIINYRLTQKLNFALLVVIEVLKGLDFVSPIDNWNLFSFDQSQFHATLFSHCYVKVNVKAKDITNVGTPIKMKITCVPENTDFFEVDRLNLVNNCLRVDYLKSKVNAKNEENKADDMAIPSVAYNQMVLNCLYRIDINQKLLQKFEKLPLVYKECLALLNHFIGIKNLDKIDNESILSCFFKFTASGQLTEKGLNYKGQVFHAFADFCKSLYQLLNEKDSIYRKNGLCVRSPVCENLDIFHNLSTAEFDLVKFKLANLVKSIGSVSDRTLYTELFANKLSLFSEYDLLLSFDLNSSYISKVEPEDLLKFNGRVNDLVVFKLLPVFAASLGKRAARIDPLNFKDSHKKDESKEKDLRVQFGVKLNFSMQAEAVIKGPLPENAKEAEKFRQLWGDDLCKLRRFKDGTICYAVAFPDFIKSKHSLRDVSKAILEHITRLHLGENSVSSIRVVSNLLEEGLTSKITGVGYFRATCEEEIQASKNKSDEFESLLYDVSKQLPLQIQSVTCLNDEVNRNSSVFPASCDWSQRKQIGYELAYNKVQVPVKRSQLFASSNNSRRLIELQIVLQTHQSWPSKSYEAVKRLKAAFYSKMGELLSKNESSLAVFPTFDGLYVQREGQVYSLTIFHPPEVKMLMRQMRTPTGALHWAHTEDSKKFELDQVLKPKLRVLFAGFEQFYPQFGPICRLVKAWVNAHLMLFEIGDLVVELLVAAMLENAHLNGNVPGSMQAGLIKFWSFVSTFNFVGNHIRLCLQDRNSSSIRDNSEQVKCTELKFDLDRSEFPNLTIFTPITPLTSDFTAHVSQPLLNRLSKLSGKAHEVVNAQLMQSLTALSAELPKVETIFKPTFASFDLIIQVASPSSQTNNEENEYEPDAKKQKTEACNDSEFALGPKLNPNSKKKILIFNVNLVEMIAKRLKACIGHLVFVFCDIYSERVDKIALKFKKSQFPEVNDWFSGNLPLIVEEIETVIGHHLIVDMKLLYEDK